MARIFSRASFKNFLIFSILFLSACVRSNDDSQPFRIVGLNGKPSKVKTRVPELNARILESQGKVVSSPDAVVIPNQEVSSQNQTNPSESKILKQDQAQQDQGVPAYNLPKDDSASQPQQEKISVGAVEEKEQEIQYDLSDSAQQKKSQGKKMRLKKGATSVSKNEDEALPKKGKKIFIQTGSFSNEENAKQALLKTQKFYKSRIEEIALDDKKFYRVLLGPFASDKKANLILRKVKAAGNDAIIVKSK